MTHDWIFQHNNDPKHRGTIVANCLDRNGVERLHWPSFSPDLNFIVHLLDEIEQRLKTKQSKIQDELKESLIGVWHGIELPILKKFVDSIPSRLNEVIRTQGYPMRY